MATHSSVLAWRIPGMGSLVGCRLWGRTESDMLMGLSKGPLPTSQPQTVAVQLCRCARRLQAPFPVQLLSPAVVMSK